MAHARQEVIDSLLKTLHETLSCYDQPEDVLARSYAPGKWNLREILVHLSDCEAVYLDRLRRLVADLKPVLQGFDETRWAQVLNYKARDLNLAKLQFEAARRGIIELARTTDISIDQNIGTHTESGTRTFKQILNMNAGHCAHHLEQARAIVAGTTWQKKG
jgi:succinate dehydrogenase flavin-adding protein (antitoxin of CptAB toxin-antitoxin module)